MAAPEQAVRPLDFWLQHISRVSPREIELGLERIRRVRQGLCPGRPARRTVVVAGTNGKGSTIAILEAVLLAAGYRVGSYTSPHLHLFNERIRIDGRPASDGALCRAFEEIERRRDAVSLTYFEFATLAALWLFERSELQVALLEVGLGGRLDAVNVVDPELTAITNVSLDHQDWLGHDVESIAAEKAGILRAGVPLVCGERKPAAAVLRRAERLGAPVSVFGRDFHHDQDPASPGWCWRGLDARGRELLLEDLPRPELALGNAALALQIAALLGLPMPVARVRRALRGLGLAGRQEWRRDRVTGRRVLLDVAHNPAATRLLAGRLADLQESGESTGHIALILAVMADKEIEGMVLTLKSRVDIWYIAGVSEARCMPLHEATARVRRVVRSDDGNHRDASPGTTGCVVKQFNSVGEAYRHATGKLSDADLLVVTGSFHTVCAIRHLSEAA